MVELATFQPSKTSNTVSNVSLVNIHIKLFITAPDPAMCRTDFASETNLWSC